MDRQRGPSPLHVTANSHNSAISSREQVTEEWAMQLAISKWQSLCLLTPIVVAYLDSELRSKRPRTIIQFCLVTPYTHSTVPTCIHIVLATKMMLLTRSIRSLPHSRDPCQNFDTCIMRQVCETRNASLVCSSCANFKLMHTQTLC